MTDIFCTPQSNGNRGKIKLYRAKLKGVSKKSTLQDGYMFVPTLIQRRSDYSWLKTEKKHINKAFKVITLYYNFLKEELYLYI